MSNRNDFLDKEFSQVEKKKTSIAYILAVLVIITACIVGYWFIVGSNMLVWFMFVFCLLFGPVTLFFYLREVKNGVFKADEDEDTEE